MHRTRILTLALATALAGAAAAHAQTPSQTPPSAPSAPAPGFGPGSDRGRMHDHMQARRAEHVAALHQALNIRSDQESAFTAFVAAMQPPPRGEWRKPEGDSPRAMAALTTPQRLDRMGQRMDERIARMREDFQRRATATKALYAALSPDQRHTMDALHELAGGRDHEGFGHGPRDHGPRDPGSMQPDAHESPDHQA